MEMGMEIIYLKLLACAIMRFKPVLNAIDDKFNPKRHKRGLLSPFYFIFDKLEFFICTTKFILLIKYLIEKFYKFLKYF